MLARLVYSTVLCLLQPLDVARLLYKSLRLASYRGRITERYGFNAPSEPCSVWVHAVSVGETITAKPIIESLLQQGHRVLVTTTTPTGAEQVSKLFGDRVTHRFMPQDIPWLLQRFIRAVQPKALLIIETELWPNLIHQCAKHQVATVLINGRLSERSARGYRRIAKLSRPMLRSITHVGVQTSVEAKRFQALGVEPRNVSVIPSLKFDATKPDAAQGQAEQWLQQYDWQDRFIWLAASTHADEEKAALDAHKLVLKQVPNALLVIVPRHPDRFKQVANVVSQSQLESAIYSSGDAAATSQVWLADVMGQMWPLIELSNVVFVGNSLNGGGGHNVMEPALCAKPIVTGAAMFNFQSVTEQLVEAGALEMISDKTQLADAVMTFHQSQPRLEAGARALKVAECNGGGVEQTLSLLKRLAITP